jgi:hypothetical protein
VLLHLMQCRLHLYLFIIMLPNPNVTQYLYLLIQLLATCKTCRFVKGLDTLHKMQSAGT